MKNIIFNNIGSCRLCDVPDGEFFVVSNKLYLKVKEAIDFNENWILCVDVQTGKLLYDVDFDKELDVVRVNVNIEVN